MESMVKAIDAATSWLCAPITGATAAIAYAQAQIGNVVEADFFDWPVEVDGGDRFVRTLARRLSRFAWDEVEHDV